MAKYQLPAAVKGRLQTLGNLIRAARRKRGFTQSELAERAGCSRPTINRIEGGGPNAAWATVMTVCWLLDIPTDPDRMDPADRAALLAGSTETRRIRGKRRLDDDF